MNDIANNSSLGACANAGTYDAVMATPHVVDRKWQSTRVHKRR
jgi:hypothetical protein